MVSESKIKTRYKWQVHFIGLFSGKTNCNEVGDEFDPTIQTIDFSEICAYWILIIGVHILEGTLVRGLLVPDGENYMIIMTNIPHFINGRVYVRVLFVYIIYNCTILYAGSVRICFYGTDYDIIPYRKQVGCRFKIITLTQILVPINIHM